MKKYNVWAKGSDFIETARGVNILAAIADYYDNYGYREIEKIELKK